MGPLDKSIFLKENFHKSSKNSPEKGVYAGLRMGNVTECVVA